jgi:perosamine synthetase
MVTTDDPELAGRLRLFRNHGITTDARQRHVLGQWHYEMVALGFNYRLSDIGAALGLSQLRRLDGNLARRRRIVERYGAAFARLPEIRVPVERAEIRSAWHLYAVQLRPERLTAGRQEVFAALRAENVGVNVHYIPVYRHPYYRRRFGDQGGVCPVAEQAYESLLTLPLFHGMTDDDVEDVIAAVEKVIGHYRL